jgi:Ca2+-binding EF-hand superfamily protein
MYTLKKVTSLLKLDFRDINGYSFKSNFISHIKQVSSLVQLQGAMEKCDRLGNGLIDKVDLCKAIQSVTKDYKDEEIMKFIRITDLFKGHQKVRYPEFLEMIFYDDQVNTFNSILSVLKKQFYNTNYNLTKLVREITGKVDVNKTFIEFSEMHNYLKLFIKDLNRNIICKLDVDQDGKISILDLKSLLEKYTKTNFFKYENNDENLEVNLFGADKLDENTFKNLVKSIKNALKQKNMTVSGLFNKLDTNGDGMITITEFNQNLDSYIEIAPHIKDMFFNYLDQRKMGMLDYNTFKVIFKEYSSEEKVLL